MVIYKAGWMRKAPGIIDMVSRVHADMTRIVGFLRDTNVELWTMVSDPDDTQGTFYNLATWMRAYRTKYREMNQFSQAGGVEFTARYPEEGMRLTGVLGSLPVIGSGFNQVLDLHRDPDGDLIGEKIPQGQRDALADTIEAELES